MNWLLLLLSMSGSIAQSAAMNRAGKKEARTASDLYLFNLLSVALGTLVILLWSGVPRASFFTLALGAAFGVATNLNMLFNLLALGSGPMCYTQLIVSSSMLVPALSGALIWSEPLSPLNVAGAALMMLSLALSVEYKKGDGARANLRWFLCCMGSFCAGGSVGVMQKVLGYSAYAEEQKGFLAAAFLVSLLCAAGNWLFSRCVRRVPQEMKLRPAVWLLAAASGGGIAAANILNLYLANVMPSIIFFPLFNGGVLLVSVAIAFLVFRERLKPQQTAGFLIGLAAVAILCLA